MQVAIVAVINRVGMFTLLRGKVREDVQSQTNIHTVQYSLYIVTMKSREMPVLKLHTQIPTDCRSNLLVGNEWTPCRQDRASCFGGLSYFFHSKNKQNYIVTFAVMFVYGHIFTLCQIPANSLITRLACYFCTLLSQRPSRV